MLQQRSMSLYGTGDTHGLYNTVACVLKMCEGRVTTIELRNEAYVTGKVVAVRYGIFIRIMLFNVVLLTAPICIFQELKSMKITFSRSTGT